MQAMTLKKTEAHAKGSFKASVVRIEEETHQFGPTLKITFQTDEGEVAGLFNASYSPGSKFGKLVKICIGKLPETFHPKELIGSDLRILVEHVPGEGEAVYDRITQFASLDTKDPFVFA